MNPLGPTFRAETQTDPTVPPLPEEEGREATAEPEDPSAELLRRVSGGAREPNASSDRISKFAASQSVSRLVHDQIEDVGERDQPRARDRASEESSGTAGGFVETQRSRQTDNSRMRSALTSTTRCCRTSLAQICRQAARS